MSVISTANSLLGKVKYSFGSNSINSSGGTGDCSSFVQYVFKQNGLSLPRTAESQYNSDKGRKVDKKDLQVGDVVFFKGTYKAGISHVGIYAGNGEFIHNSSAKGKTVKSSLNSEYYKKHYAGAVRYRGVNGGNNNSIVNIAESLKGQVKYDYNHKNSYVKKGDFLYVDCTGFVTYVLRKAGVIDNKTSMNGYYKKAGVQRINNLKDLKAGDVIYYADKNKKVWHMNIYAGNGYVIESTRSKNGWYKTKMYDLYKKDFLTAVRFPSQGETEETSEKTETQTGDEESNTVWKNVNRFAGGIITIISLIILFILMIYLLTQSFMEGE